jgi:integrase
VSWIARYQAPDRVQRSKAFAHRVDAERFLHDLEARKSRGEWIDPAFGKTPLSEWVDRWRGTTVHLKPKTQAGYESLLRTLILPEFGRARLGAIDPLWIREWVTALVGRGLSASRVRQAYRLLGAILLAAVESNYIARSPCIGVRLPRMPMREMSFLSADQVRDLAEAAGEHRTLVYVLAYGGFGGARRRPSGGGGATCFGGGSTLRNPWRRLARPSTSALRRPINVAP